jgi:hypothetical protein
LRDLTPENFRMGAGLSMAAIGPATFALFARGAVQ